MNRSNSALLLGAVAVMIASGAAGVQPVAAQGAKLVAGTLTCKGKGSVGLILGSKQTLSCSFNPASNRPKEYYTATITKLGLDVGVKGKSTMVWTVLSSTTDLPSGALAGQYAGVAADASVGVGGGANALVGGNKKSVTLQPLSVQGQTGLNVAVGVAGLKLTRN